MNNQRATVNDENMQRMLDTNAAMTYSGQLVLAQNMSARPVNTQKAYAGKQKEWRVSQHIFLSNNLQLMKYL